jgi:hypothetical protein
MEVLPPDVREFLATVGLDDCATNSFLASNTADLASKYEEWRQRTGKGDLMGSAKGIVYSWKQDVTRKQRENMRGEATAAAAAAAAAMQIMKSSGNKNITTPLAPSQPQQPPPAKKRNRNRTVTGRTTSKLALPSPSSTITTGPTALAPIPSVFNEQGYPPATSSGAFCCSDSDKNNDGKSPTDDGELIWQPQNHVRVSFVIIVESFHQDTFTGECWELPFFWTMLYGIALTRNIAMISSLVLLWNAVPTFDVIAGNGYVLLSGCVKWSWRRHQPTRRKRMVPQVSKSFVR